MPDGDGVDSTGRWVHELIDREHRFSLSTEVATGRHQLQVEICLGVVDVEIAEDLDDESFRAHLADPPAAAAHAERVRTAEFTRRAASRPTDPCP